MPANKAPNTRTTQKRKTTTVSSSKVTPKKSAGKKNSPKQARISVASTKNRTSKAKQVEAVSHTKVLLSFAAISLLVFGALGILQATYSYAATVTGPFVGNSGKCLDNDGARAVNGNKIQLYTCNSTVAQKWTVPGDGTIRVQGKCLDVKSGSKTQGAYVQLYSCNGTGAQKWIINDDTSIMNIASKYCLHPLDRTTTSGTQIQQWYCNGSKVQKWTIPTEVGTITPAPVVDGQAPVRATPSAPTPEAAPAPAPTPTEGGKTISVSTSSQLTLALKSVKPGDVIKLSDGVYKSKIAIGNGSAAFAVTVSGTAQAPIKLTGSRNAIIEGGSLSGIYGLYLYKVNYWSVSGITVRNASKGIVADGSNNNIIDRVKVTNIGEEGVHFRSFSSGNTISNSEISATGKGKPEYGEGVYLGSANSNWSKFSGGKPDTSDRNHVINNKISQTGAESIDIKEGTSRGVITGNSFNGAGMSGANFADSWVDVKGNGYTVSDNTGINAILDGIQVHNVVAGWGNDNVFQNNKLNVSGPGVGFNIQSKATGTAVYCNNTVTNAKGGFGNISCRR